MTPTERKTPLILTCSPRKGGNTDTAATLLAEVMGPGQGEVRRLADLPLRPCISCGGCESRPGTCSLNNAPLPGEMSDQTLPLLREWCAAPLSCLVSPIYFYHFPAQAKAFIDRAQSFWAMPPNRKPGQGRSFGVILLAARPRGEKLFEGALLTLRLMADALGMVPAEPLLLRGLDEADALLQRPDLQDEIRDYGRRLAEYHLAEH